MLVEQSTGGLKIQRVNPISRLLRLHVIEISLPVQAVNTPLVFATGVDSNILTPRTAPASKKNHFILL